VCDTIYCAPFFGKNSDRTPSEPQSVCILPGRPASDSVKAGGRKFDVADGGLAYLLSKPSWIWGGEMGVNSSGVAIGNEAVFSRTKPARDGILGMDILRAALGTAATAKEAVDFICRFVEAHDQGGNGAYKGSLYYDNSFLISDPLGAYIVETAGRRWAWRAAASADSISNAYCIGNDYKRLDAQTRKEIAPVDPSMACSSEGEPGRIGARGSFKAHVENRFYLGFSQGEERRALSLSLLGKFAGELPAARSIVDFLDILRSHGPYDPRKPWSGHMKSLCVHAGGVPASATTASLAVEYKKSGSALIWFPASPYPCLSLYKPVILHKGEFIPLWTGYDYAEGALSSVEIWERWRTWIVSAHASSRSLDPGFAAARRLAQSSLAMIADSALSDLEESGDASSLSVLAQEAGAVVAGWEKDCGL
jgi:secernin